MGCISAGKALGFFCGSQDHFDKAYLIVGSPTQSLGTGPWIILGGCFEEAGTSQLEALE
jgi:hypothetical protein